LVKKNERILREILYRVYELGENFATQTEIADSCGVSLDLVNQVVTRLSEFGGVQIQTKGVYIINPKKILFYWATRRNLRRDIVYSTRCHDPPQKIESRLSADFIFTCYSGYRLKFGTSPSYDEVYAYGKPEAARALFPESPGKRPNLFIIKEDEHLRKRSRGRSVTLAQMYVDLWQLGTPAADEILAAMEKKLDVAQIRAFLEAFGEG
jgi:hypothetical protein